MSSFAHRPLQRERIGDFYGAGVSSNFPIYFNLIFRPDFEDVHSQGIKMENRAVVEFRPVGIHHRQISEAKLSRRSTNHGDTFSSADLKRETAQRCVVAVTRAPVQFGAWCKPAIKR
jgi:hypothetical protein